MSGIHGGVRRLGWTVGLILVSGLAAALAPTAALGAAPGHPFLETFGSAAQPSFGNAAGMAVDQSTGDVYVIDLADESLKRYHQDGTPADFSALTSTNVIDGHAGEADATPQERIIGPVGVIESQVAIDNSGGPREGDIYVTDLIGHVIDVFAPTGQYLEQITEASSGPLGVTCGVAVGPEGSVYVSDFGAVHKFGSPPVDGSSVEFATVGTACQLAAGAGPTAGSIFVNEYGGNIVKLDDETGAVEYIVYPGESTTVSADLATGHVYSAVRGANQLKEFNASGGAATEVSSTALTREAQGVAVNQATGNVYVTREGGANVEVFAPIPPPPTVVGVAPGKGPTGGGQVVTVTGTNLTGATKVEIGGTAVTCAGTVATCKVESPSELKFTTPAHASGIVDVIVTTIGGTSTPTAADRYTFGAPPAVTGISPARGPVAGGNLVTITGLRLSEASKVEFGGTAVNGPFPENSATSISVPAPPHVSGAVHVIVTTSGGSSGRFPEDEYTYVDPQALAVNSAGNGTGAITCDGGPCASSYAFGTTVTLAATAAPGSSFAGFSGACAGSGSCTLTIEGPTAVTATFDKNPAAAPPESIKKGTPKIAATASTQGNVATLKISCVGGGGCSGTVILKSALKQGGKVKNVTIGKAQFKVAAATTANVKVKITNAHVKRLLKSGKTVKAAVSGGGLGGTVKLVPAKGR